MNKLFRLYRDIFNRRPAFFIISLAITIGLYGYVLMRLGLINVDLFSQPRVTIRFEPTEIYDAGSTQLGLKRVHLLSNSKDPIAKVSTTIEAPSFAEITVVSSPTVKADISKFESSSGRRRFEILFRTVESKQELVIVLVGKKSPSWREAPPSNDVAVVVETVATTKSGRLFGASAVGEFSLRDSEQAQTYKEELSR